MSRWQLDCKDVLAWCAEYDGPKFHAMLCDPPYHLTTITKRFGKEDAAPAQYGRDGAFQRVSKGFMGSTWDGETDGIGIAFRPETWAALKEHLLPGAFIFVFGSSRGWHRLAVAIEDAGFVFHPSLMVWGWVNGCLSEDTEILTSEGWKHRSGLLASYTVLCYNVDENALKWLPIQEVFEYEYQDTAYQITSDSTNQIVTGNHRCLVERGGKLVFREASTLQFQETVPILESLHCLQGSIHNSECRPGPESDLLFSAMHKEGQKSEPQAQGEIHHLSSLRSSSIQNGDTSTKDRKPNLFKTLQWGSQRRRVWQTWLQGILALVRGKQAQTEGKDDWCEQSSLEGRRNLPQPQGQLSHLQDKIRALSSRVLGNGSEGRICNGAQAAGSPTGGTAIETLRGSASQRPQPRKQRPGKLDAICEQLSTQELRGRWRLATTLATITPVSYKGKVWCVRVPTGAFVARRDGHVFITGNSGFPKSTRIDTQIDRAAGAEQEKEPDPRWENQSISIFGGESHRVISEAVTDLARAWEGHRYGRQALKPAVEMIICAQKPYEGRPVDSIVETGAGALFIDGGRVGITTEDAKAMERCNTPGSGRFQDDKFFAHKAKDYPLNTSQGRWPPNFALCHVPPHICAACNGDGCDECNDTGLVGGCRRVGTKRVKGTGTAIRRNLPDEGGKQQIDIKARTQHGPDVTYADPDGYEETAAWQCCEECAARRIGEQSGISSERLRVLHHKSASGFVDDGAGYETTTHGDIGTCARFFPQFGWAAEIAESRSYKWYLACINGHEFRQDKKPDVCPECGSRWQIELPGPGLGWTCNAPDDWSAEIAERLANSDQVRYCAKASRGEREAGLRHIPIQTMHRMRPDKDEPTGLNKEPRWAPTKVHNPHPTVKPIALCRWLATLLLPPPEYAPRRILIPFSGVSSEGIGAMLAGFDEIVMIEQDAEYCKIGESRMQFWSQFDSYEEAMETTRQLRGAQKAHEGRIENGQLELW